MRDFSPTEVDVLMDALEHYDKHCREQVGNICYLRGEELLAEARRLRAYQDILKTLEELCYGAKVDA